MEHSVVMVNQISLLNISLHWPAHNKIVPRLNCLKFSDGYPEDEAPDEGQKQNIQCDNKKKKKNQDNSLCINNLKIIVK